MTTRTDHTLPTATTTLDTTHARTAGLVAAGPRIALGWIFLWAFLDKLFGLGHETKAAAAWVNGGHPTEGFLAKAAAGPFKGLYNGLAGVAVVDWLFMLGLLTIGVALIAGIAMRFAAVAGGLLLVLMWTAVLPPANNPFMDDHLIYAGLLALLTLLGAGRVFGFGAAWERLPIVQRFPFLR